MHDEDAAAPFVERPDKVANEAVRRVLVDADAVLHRHGLCGRRAHGGKALGNECGLEHKRRAKAPLLNALRGAAAVEVVFVVAVAFGDLNGLRKRFRVGAAELQRHGVLAGREAEKPIAVAVDDRARRHHLGVKARTLRELPVHEAAVSVRPVEHRRNRKAPVDGIRCARGARRCVRRHGVSLL